jgi:hypothetical protein
VIPAVSLWSPVVLVMGLSWDFADLVGTARDCIVDMLTSLAMQLGCSSSLHCED